MNYTDFQNPETQRSAANLQLVDYLSGQVDRTRERVRRPKDGPGHRIDNEPRSAPVARQDATGRIPSARRFVPAQAGRCSDRQRILGMKEEELMKLLGGKDGDLQKLNEDEKAAALERFKNLKEHVGTLQHDDLLVKQWNNDTSPSARQRPESELHGRWASRPPTRPAAPTRRTASPRA
jgi:hypothetical protein